MRSSGYWAAAQSDPGSSLQLPSIGSQLPLACIPSAVSDDADDGDESPIKQRPRLLSVGTERRVHVSEQLTLMFHALPAIMQEDLSEVIS